MCGVCGIVSYSGPPDLALLRRMMGRLGHRGPDGNGYYRDRHAALGHTRLAIIDTSGGAQPLCNEDGTVWVTFNGEIFNYVELGEELRHRGHTFRTASDTEVIVHAWEEWGEECFSRFNGQWAIALWDRRAERLVLSRDRLGVRPLFFTRRPAGLLFASEVKSIFADPSVERAFDPAGLDQTFTYWSPVAPRTVFRGIEQLEPGHYAVLDRDGFRKAPYWRITFPERGREPDAGRPGERRGPPGADHRGNPPAVPAQRRPGWGVPVGRSRLVRHGRRHLALHGRPPAHVLAALLRQRVRRGAIPEEDVRSARDAAPGHHGEPVRHRGGLPRGHLACRDPDPARGARAAVPALEAGAGERLQGRSDGRGGRRGPRRVRPLPRGTGAPVLVAGSGIGEAHPGGGAALPVDGPVPRTDAGLRPQLLRPPPGPGRSGSLAPAAVGFNIGDQEHAVGRPTGRGLAAPTPRMSSPRCRPAARTGIR